MQKFLIEDRVPCQYELSWYSDKKAPSLILRIHNEIVRDLNPIAADAPIVKIYREKLGFQKFEGSPNGHFGFDNALQLESQASIGFTSWRIPLPSVKQLTGKKCCYCGGSGAHSFIDDQRCLSCGGSGNDYKMNHRVAFAIAASLDLLFSIIPLDVETSALTPQLMHLRLCTELQMGGSAFSATFGSDLVQWLRSLPKDYSLDKVKQALMLAYGTLSGGLGSLELYYFRVDLSEGRYGASCPGNCCCCYSEQHVSNLKRGYELTSHNMDGPIQQLAHIVALAALQDLAREEMKSTILDKEH